ncbi:hypothetical protein GCM10011578_085200 [Streptomyces fuscichromogenes]|uniref:Uncharacterized protein n=1 Tax=Streptomyces fuscichromogenes TaxID=1324013 RepID=A0A918CWJ0_9ACTN|nr:hypothetical protein GCM10011578_085200 [Streptomyces fuscichromogenes]
MGVVGDDHGGAAVGEDVLQLGGGHPGVDRHADAACADHGEVALHHLHAVAQQHRHPVAGPQPRLCEVSGQPTGARLQLGVADGPVGVPEGDLVAESSALFPQEFMEGTNQFGAQHATHTSLRA